VAGRGLGYRHPHPVSVLLMTPTQTIPDEHLETVACSLCGANESKHLFSIRGFPIRECARCGMRYVSPRMRFDKLVEMYSQEAYYKSDNSLVHGYVDYVADRDNIVKTFARRLGWVAEKLSRPSPGSVLDVGCAAGFSIDYALEQGWNAYGIEPSEFAASVARKRLGDRVVQGTLESHPFSLNQFDTVLLWDVIEHVPDPIKTLRQTAAIMKTGAVLSLITPDVGSAVARLMGRRWMEYAKPTEHIHFFTRRTMTTALERAGFEVVAAGTAGKLVGCDFLLDRLVGHLPALLPLKSRWGNRLARHTLYINPGDKMHLLARKR
jgi:2-polyprenyl-3-methyl-5-hydroxy-6-metoxy-1,4-benzoquinol methylase